MKVPHLVCVLCTVLGAGPSLSALDREAFTITKYDLQVELEPEQHRLGARGKVRLRNDSAQSQKNAVLQISSTLDWRSIRIDGKTVQFVSQPYTSAIDHTGGLTEAIVTFPAEIRPKDSVEIEIGYEGTIALDATRLTDIGVPDEVARRTSWDQISKSFTAVRGAGYVAWYPIATESADFSEGNSLFQVVERWKHREALAAMTIQLCTQFSGDQAPYLVMNGPPRAEADAGGSDHRACIVHGFDQLGTVVPVFLAGDIKPKAPIPGAAWVSIFFVPGREARASSYETLLESTTPFVTQWFGAPKTPITIADVSGRAGPFESGTLLLTAMESPDQKFEQTILVHELVHSAFSSPRAWIDEGLAHFAEALYREQQEGRPAAIVFLGAHRPALVESENEVPALPQGDAGQPLATTFDETYYRTKAAYVWWMLRDMVGGDALKQAIHNYRAADDKDPKYIEQLVEASSKRDLAWFFDDWVYHDRGLPDFHVQAAHPWKDEKGVQIVTLTVENSGSAGAEVPVALHFADGVVVRRLEVRGRSSATTRIAVPGATTQVVVNDGSIPESDLDNNIFKIPNQ